LKPAFLLDVNVLLALSNVEHLHHNAAHQWFEHEHRQGWGTCCLTQLAFVRLMSNPKLAQPALSPQQALKSLEIATAHPSHRFFKEPPTGLIEMALRAYLDRVLTHNGLTDAFLAALAHAQGARLATFDQGIKRLYGQSVELLQSHSGSGSK
jgi:hypothetical protein